MAPPTKPNDGFSVARSEDSASTSRVQRVPSFKLLDDDRARSKRFRNRVPSAVGRSNVGDGNAGMSTPSSLIENARSSPYLAAAGPRRVSSFNLTSDVFRMSHTSSWGSGVGGNIFGFGPASVDGEGEDIVQRLDDASFNDLNFLTMEGVGPSDISGKVFGERSTAGIDMKASEKRATAAGGRSFDRNSASTGYLCGGTGCDRQATVSKEEIVANAIVDRTGSARDILSRASSVRDVLRSGSMVKGESNHDVFGTNEFALDEELPIFSSSMEEYLNHQLEAAERSLDSSAVAERPYSQIAHRGGDVVDGNDGEMHSVTMGTIRAGGSSHSLTSARAAKAKPERNRYVCDADGIRRIGTQSAQVEAEDLKPTMTERRPRYDSVPQPQRRQQHESEEEAESSYSEYEPPALRKEKSNKRRGKERAAAAAAAAAAATSEPSGEASGGATDARAASSASAVLRRSTPKRQTSEDVAARLPLEVLECFYHVPLNVAAVQLDVSLTMLKKLCRTYGVKRWPHRQVSSLDKTMLKLEEKIKARNDGGKDAPSLVRKLTQAKKRRSVIIKTASAGLDATVLNSLFTCRPGAIDEDLLLSSTNVAEAVGKIHSALEVDHETSESESESGDHSDHSSSGGGGSSGSGSDRDLDESDVRSDSLTVEPSPAAPKRTLGMHTAFAAPPPSSKPSTIANSLSVPPPAFEPGGRPQSAASKNVARKRGEDAYKAASKQLVASRKTSAKPRKKMERAATSAKRAKKVAVSTGKGRKVVAARSVSAAGCDGSTPPKPKTAAATAAVLPSAYTSEGPGFGSDISGRAIAPKAEGSGADSAALSFGNTPLSRAQATGYSGSGVFGIGLRHPSSVLSNGRRGSTILSGAARAAGSSKKPLDPSQRRAASGIPRMQQATRPPARVDAVGKRALGYREWRGASCSQSRPLPQQHLKQTGSESPTATAALERFDLKLNLDSPSGGGLHQASTAPPPPPPLPLHPHGHHPYLLHHQFPHRHHHHHHHRHQPHPHPSSHSLGWVGGQYPWLPHQPYGFPMELMSPIDTRLPPPQRGPRCRNLEAFSKLDDGGEDASDCTARGKPSGTSEAHAMSGGAATEAAVALAESVATATVEAKIAPQDAEPRRTGFMSYLLHQAPQSPPFSSSPSPSAPLPIAGGGSARVLKETAYGGD